MSQNNEQTETTELTEAEKNALEIALATLALALGQVSNGSQHVAR